MFGFIVQPLKHVGQKSVIELASGEGKVPIDFALWMGRRNAPVKQVIEPREDSCVAPTPLAMRRCA